MGCHFLLQEIFPSQGLNLGLLHCRRMLLPSEPPGKLLGDIKYSSLCFEQLRCAHSKGGQFPMVSRAYTWKLLQPESLDGSAWTQHPTELCHLSDLTPFSVFLSISHPSVWFPLTNSSKKTVLRHIDEKTNDRHRLSINSYLLFSERICLIGTC